MDLQGVDPEHVDIDPSVGNWRPSPLDPKPQNNAADRQKPAALAETGGTNNPSTEAKVDANELSAARIQRTPKPPSLKTEVDPNAPTFYDLT